MRRLLVLRHAKAARPAGLDDHERPLTDEGRDAARRIGAYLRDNLLMPDYAVVSTARRTRETWGAVAEALQEDVPTISEARIYEASAETLLGIVRETEGAVRTCLIVGHNPGFHELATQCVGHGDRYAFQRLAGGMPTAALAVIDFPVDDWGEVTWRSGRLDRFVTPSDLGGRDDG